MLNTLSRNDECIEGKKNVVLQRDNANSMDGASKQRLVLKNLKKKSESENTGVVNKKGWSLKPPLTHPILSHPIIYLSENLRTSNVLDLT